MSFFKRQEIGRIYVLKLVLPDDTIVHKIGMCNSSRSTDRMLEILRSWFMSFRFIPYTELRLDLECQDPAKLEAHMHRILRDQKFSPHHKVDGGTEMFVEINEMRVIHYIRAYANSLYVDPPELSDEGYKIICRLLTQ